jgi:2-keto-4-pentenoate hydratase/2-oxohepta-3-ene-1,7-dioic acid hydratase in catechol pathway
MKIGRWEHQGSEVEGWFKDSDGSLLAIPFTEGLSCQKLFDLGLKGALEVLKGQQQNESGAVPLTDVKLLTPFTPKSIRDSVAFEEHVEGVVKSIDNSAGVVPEWYEFPTFYFTNPHSLIATETTMVPPPSQMLDFELELGIVVGAVSGPTLSNLSTEAAKDAIFGFTIFNDWSARDIQSREMKVRLGPAKGKDFATTIGPWIVTADEFADKIHDEFHHLMMQVFVNGKLIGEDSLANIGWPLNELIAYASRNSVVLPGDLIGSGTAGSGCLAELWGRNGSLTPPPLQEGDVVEMKIEGIGSIRNTVGKAVVAPAIPRARPGRRVQISR